MTLQATLTAYEVTLDCSPELVNASILANALGSSVSMTGVCEVNVVTGVVSFAMTSAAYDYIIAVRNVYNLIVDIEERFNTKVAEVDAKVNEALSEVETSVSEKLEEVDSEVSEKLADAEATFNDYNARAEKAMSDFKDLDTRAEQALNDADTAIAHLRNVSLSTFPTIAISKAYYAELKEDSAKWNAFMDQYDGYMLYIIQSEDKGPFTPTPPSTTWKFGDSFPIKFTGGDSWHFGGNFPIHFEETADWKFGTSFPIKFN